MRTPPRELLATVLSPTIDLSLLRRKRMLELWLESHPRLRPDRYNNYEPIRTPFPPGDVLEVAQCWTWNLHWRKSKPRVSGSFFTDRNGPTSLAITYSVPAFDKALFYDFVRRVASDFGLIFASVHVQPPYERIASSEKWLRREQPYAFVTIHQLREGLPSAAWLMCFGPPYVELFGARLEKAGAAPLEDAPGVWFVETQPDIPDYTREFEAVQERRERLEKLLGDDAFRAYNRERKARIPEFELLPEQ